MRGLKTSLPRFNKEALEIGGVSEDLMRASFRCGIRCADFIHTLTGPEGMPISWDKIMSAAKVYA
ncbi:hypothetical protein HanPI659440_Chr17g0683291 [Helianthus annuus]|nr:hypothetical protein HanPI659440_Chr17g0683291 [Helianthus annuus]